MGYHLRYIAEGYSNAPPQRLGKRGLWFPGLLAACGMIGGRRYNGKEVPIAPYGLLLEARDC